MRGGEGKGRDGGKGRGRGRGSFKFFAAKYLHAQRDTPIPPVETTIQQGIFVGANFRENAKMSLVCIFAFCILQKLTMATLLCTVK